MSASLLCSCESILGDLDKDDVDDEEEEEIVEWGTALLEELIIRGTGITSIDLRHNPLLRVVDAESTSLNIYTCYLSSRLRISNTMQARLRYIVRR